VTAPFDITEVVPLKYKPLVGLIGSALTFIIPTVLEYSTSLPDPWPWVIAAVVALLTALGVYKAPYKPQGTVLVEHPDPVVQRTGPTGTVLDGTINVVPGEYRNPWQ
jgi:hypothetical protein